MPDESNEGVQPAQAADETCVHSNKESQTEVTGKAGRFHCEDCGQCYGGDPQPTKAAVKRDKKALKKHKFPKSTPGAQSITISGDALKASKKVDEAVEEENRSKDLGQRAVPALGVFRDFVTVIKAEKTAAKAKQTFVEQLKANPQVFLVAQEIADFFQVRRGRKLIMPNGKVYTSVKPLIKDEVGCSYEYLCEIARDIRRFNCLLEAADRPQTHRTPSQPQASTPAQTTTINLPPQDDEAEEPQQKEESPVSLSVEDIGRRVIAYAQNLARFLSPAEKDKLHGYIHDHLESEREFEVAEEMQTAEVA